MFMPDDLPLIRYGNRNVGGFIQNNALATQAAFESRTDGAIDKILFLVGYFFQKTLPAFDIDVTSGTSANASAVVVEVNIVVLRYLQDGHVQKIAGHRFGWDGFIFKLKSYSSHFIGMWSMG